MCSSQHRRYRLSTVGPAPNRRDGRAPHSFVNGASATGCIQPRQYIQLFDSTLLVTGVGDFQRPGLDPISGTGVPNSFIDRAVPASESRAATRAFVLPSRGTISFTDLAINRQVQDGPLGLGLGLGLESTAPTGTAAGSIGGSSGHATAGPGQRLSAPDSMPNPAPAHSFPGPVEAGVGAAAATNPTTDHNAPAQTAAAATGAFDRGVGAANNPAAYPTAAAPAVMTVSTASASAGGETGEGPDRDKGDCGDAVNWRFSLRGLYDALCVDLFMQAVGSNVDPGDVNKVPHTSQGLLGAQLVESLEARVFLTAHAGSQMSIGLCWSAKSWQHCRGGWARTALTHQYVLHKKVWCCIYVRQHLGWDFLRLLLGS